MIRSALSLLFSSVGWYLGMPLGFVGALLLSSVGMGIGIYYGRKLEQA